MLFGLDISHHQASSLDLARCKREGIEFVFMKSSEGANFVDPEFTANLNEARAAGLLVAAYHYVRSDASAASQVANVARVVPKDVPVIPDAESGSGSVALLREFVRLLGNAGYRVPFTYLPRWYWQQLGSPALAGLPPLWSSRYPDNVVGTIADEWADVPSSYWNGYGGLPVGVLQFTSSAAIAGHQPLDANAYPGTRDQLAVTLGQGTIQEEDPMFASIELAPTDEPREITIALPWQGGSGGVNQVFAMVTAGAEDLTLNVCHWQRHAPGGVLEPGLPVVPDGTVVTARDRTSGVQAPANVHALIINYTGAAGGSVVIEAAR